MTSSAFPLEGGCVCGKTRYRLESCPLVVHCCHCTSCQQESGTAFVVNAVIEADRIVLLDGKLLSTDMPTESGGGQVVARCSECFVTLWSKFGGLGDKFRVLRIGTLDQPHHCPPDLNIYVRSKQPWLILQPDVPALEAYYDREQYWTPESLQRRRELLGGPKGDI
jgi:hypothetical protein